MNAVKQAVQQFFLCIHFFLGEIAFKVSLADQVYILMLDLYQYNYITGESYNEFSWKIAVRNIDR